MASNWSQKYIGIPYVSNGTSFDGVDCGGLVLLVYKEEIGLDLTKIERDYKTLDKAESDKGIRSFLSKYAKKIDSPKDMCCVLFKWTGYENHIGLYVDGGLILHSKAGEQVKRVPIDDVGHLTIAGYYEPK